MRAPDASARSRGGLRERSLSSARWVVVVWRCIKAQRAILVPKQPRVPADAVHLAPERQRLAMSDRHPSPCQNPERVAAAPSFDLPPRAGATPVVASISSSRDS